MTYDLYEPSVELAELPGEYCPSVDNDPPSLDQLIDAAPERPPFKPLWRIRRSHTGNAHHLPGKTIYTGFHTGYFAGQKWAGVETTKDAFEPSLSVKRASVAQLFRYLRKKARNAHY
jgi:hypothetical protein